MKYFGTANGFSGVLWPRWPRRFPKKRTEQGVEAAVPRLHGKAPGRRRPSGVAAERNTKGTPVREGAEGGSSPLSAAIPVIVGHPQKLQSLPCKRRGIECHRSPGGCSPQAAVCPSDSAFGTPWCVHWHQRQQLGAVALSCATWSDTAACVLLDALG